LTSKFEEINSLIKGFEDRGSVDVSLEAKNLKKIVHLLSNYELRQLIHKVENEDYLNSFNYSNLIDLEYKFRQLTDELTKAKEDIDLDEFYKRGDVLNFKKLRARFKKLNLIKRYPKFNFDRYEELFRNPVMTLENYKGEKIKYDKFLVKKVMIAINQMIFDEMDLYMLNVGKEGAGKSCFSSQLILYLYWILKEIGLVEYAYDIKKLFFSSLKTMLEEQDAQENGDYFRIMTLDEAYELNRGNYREDTSKSFKDDMRSGRKMQRIIILNLPQIGELETSILLTRVNFIFFSDMDSDPETGTVKKGVINMHILPRGKNIYSPFQRRNVSGEEITNSITKVMKDKNDSYKGLPKNTLVHKFKVKGVWGFDKEKYDSHIKKENKKRRLAGEIRVSDYVGYILYKKLPPIKNWGSFDMKDRTDKKMYYTIQKFLRQNITNRYVLNPELLTKFELLYSAEEK